MQKLLKSENFSAVTGKGVEATIGGKNIALGNPKMMEYAQAEITAFMQDEVKKYQKQGKTVSYLAIDNEVAGYVVIGDKIKETSKNAIAALQNKESMW
jgi:P-type E1-E2 ATPase